VAMFASSHAFGGVERLRVKTHGVAVMGARKRTSNAF